MLKKQELDIKNGKTSELSDLQSQIDELTEKLEQKKALLIEKLNKEKEELEKKQIALQREIFVLQSQIYGIRCYLGEVVNFYYIRTGAAVPIEKPIIIHQKIRYLDEELGKYVSLYHFGNSEGDKQTLLSILKTRDDIVSLLAPEEKSVSVLKISRTGKIKGALEIL